MYRTAILTVAGALSLAACAHGDRARDSKVPLGATEMQPTDAPSPRPRTDVASRTATSSSSPDDSHTFATAATPVADVAPSSSPEAVSTRVNAKNPSDSHAAPTDQGRGAADLAISAAIRRALMADKKLSAPAKNVTILTSDSRVVLRGKVNSVQERARVDAKTWAIGGVTEVYNQLEVRR
jgi:hyperosmotically inducible protein